MFRLEDFKDLRCMCSISKENTELLVAGCQDTMFRVDVEKGEVLQTVRRHVFPHQGRSAKAALGSSKR